MHDNALIIQVPEKNKFHLRRCIVLLASFQIQPLSKIKHSMQSSFYLIRDDKKIFVHVFSGVLIQAHSMFGTSKVIELTYVHLLCSGLQTASNIMNFMYEIV